MYENFLLGYSKEALSLVLLASIPPLGAGMLAGLIISVLQAATSVQEQTTAIIVKLIVVFCVLVFLGPWIGSNILKFASSIFTNLPLVFP